MDQMTLLKMKLEDLSCLYSPRSPLSRSVLPEGYSFRMFKPGDETIWVELQSKADIYTHIDLNLFFREFVKSREELNRRMVFLCHLDRVVGTATAWADDISGNPEVGRLHWVAIIPEYQGRGLSKPLLAFTLSLFPGLGYTSAFLLTNLVRFPAISLYLKVGFQPEVRNKEEKKAWTIIRRKTGNQQDRRR